MNLKFLLSTAVVAVSLTATAQKDNKAYIISGKANNAYFWSDIKQLDLTTGETKNLFETGVSEFKATGTGIKMNGNVVNSDPMAYGVAACALDSRSNRLFFTPLHYAQLRYIDLDSKTPQFAFLDLNLIAAPNGAFLSEENHITRMAIAADGYGYAVTNDANHLIRFSTGKNPVATDLGNIVDADGKGISIHNKCTSWGGDMIADAFGKLYIISANHQVFSIDAASRIATHLGTIKGLPANYTTNGAVVSPDGKIVVSSANTFDGLYTFALNDLAASKINITGLKGDGIAKINGSDMANGNFLLQKEADAATAAGRPVLVDLQQPIGNDFVAVYPNPVTGNQFTVDFKRNKPGIYNIALTDLAGRVLLNKVANIQAEGQAERVSLKSKPAQGMYLIKVTNSDKEIIFSDKIFIN
jgi:hypothetical protein